MWTVLKKFPPKGRAAIKIVEKRRRTGEKMSGKGYLYLCL
jgi:hypothetical protein